MQDPAQLSLGVRLPSKTKPRPGQTVDIHAWASAEKPSLGTAAPGDVELPCLCLDSAGRLHDAERLVQQSLAMDGPGMTSLLCRHQLPNRTLISAAQVLRPRTFGEHSCSRHAEDEAPLIQVQHRYSTCSCKYCSEASRRPWTNLRTWRRQVTYGSKSLSACRRCPSLHVFQTHRRAMDRGALNLSTPLAEGYRRQQ